MDIDFEVITSTGDRVLEQGDMLAQLCVQIFDDFDLTYLHGHLPHIGGSALHLAVNTEGQPIGFKLGYRRAPALFYSWLGGVIPAMRRQGVAERLMIRQHDWARSQGYKHVETRTRADNNAMIIRNLKSGFHIVGHDTDPNGRPIVIQRIALV